MKFTAINLVENKTYYRLNEEHTVCIHKDSEDLICVYVMDNNKKILNYLWCENTSITKIEKIASEMLYKLGYDGEIVEYNPYEGQAYYYLPDSFDLKFPLDIHFINHDPKCKPISVKETINSEDEYYDAMKRHKENEDTLVSMGSVHFDEIHNIIYRIQEYSECAVYEFVNLSEEIQEMIERLDQGFSKEFVDQLKEAYEMNKYLQEKVWELDRKLPKGLHLEYPCK
ncbi:hypothetical protein [Anaerocolumna aminovalerica]|uniref:hypothetical protein n=1 Tax=Anaerocolumna aminovalerica TaxID=1527 RepID=UPI000BE3281B|nr:hypothetical protein [Anaerocolumna aminovalerica]